MAWFYPFTLTSNHSVHRGHARSDGNASQFIRLFTRIYKQVTRQLCQWSQWWHSQFDKFPEQHVTGVNCKNKCNIITCIKITHGWHGSQNYVTCSDASQLSFINSICFELVRRFQHTVSTILDGKCRAATCQAFDRTIFFPNFPLKCYYVARRRSRAAITLELLNSFHCECLNLNYTPCTKTTARIKQKWKTLTLNSS